MPSDVPRSDQVGTDEPEVMEVEDSRQPIGALLFKTETERTPITEENRERLDKILSQIIGKPFLILVLVVFLGGIQGVNFWLNQLGFLIQFPRYTCVFEPGLTEDEK